MRARVRGCARVLAVLGLLATTGVIASTSTPTPAPSAASTPEGTTLGACAPEQRGGEPADGTSLVTCRGTEGAACTVPCRPGFAGVGALWACRSGAWVETRQPQCQAGSCGAAALGNAVVVDASQCTDTLQGATCTVRCLPGYEVLGSSATVLQIMCMPGGTWRNPSGLTCQELNGCDGNPCDARLSDCFDNKPPLTGYSCKCKGVHMAKPGEEGADGKGCAKPGLSMRDGAFYLSVGGGHDIHFVRAGQMAESRTSVSGLYARLDLSEAALLRVVATSRPNVTGMLTALLRPDGPVVANTAAIDLLTGPGGLVTRHGDQIALTEADADLLNRQPDGLLSNLTARALDVEATIADDIRTIQTELFEIGNNHTDTDTAHAGTLNLANSVELDLQAEQQASDANQQRNRARVLGVVARLQQQEQTLGNFDCAAETDVNARIQAILTAVRGIPNAIVPAVLRAQCEGNGLQYNPATQACLLPPLGTSSFSPAKSCKDLLATAHGRTSGAYFLALTDGSVHQTYCDQTTRGGGWELLMKMNAGSGVSATFAYDSSHWTVPSTLNEHSLDTTLVDAKFHAFNVQAYSNLEARWDDGGFTWVWQLTLPSGFTPLAYFQTPRTLNGDAIASREWQAASRRFSAQFGFRRYVINGCGGNGACVRWGFQFSDSTSNNSNDAEGGIGLRYLGGKSAGDTYRCCGQRGANRAFRVAIFGR